MTIGKIDWPSKWVFWLFIHVLIVINHWKLLGFISVHPGNKHFNGPINHTARFYSAFSLYLFINFFLRCVDGDVSPLLVGCDTGYSGVRESLDGKPGTLSFVWEELSRVGNYIFQGCLADQSMLPLQRTPLQ